MMYNSNVVKVLLVKLRTGVQQAVQSRLTSCKVLNEYLCALGTRKIYEWQWNQQIWENIVNM